jgi:glucose/arabinose dehydrogenase
VGRGGALALGILVLAGCSAPEAAPSTPSAVAPVPSPASSSPAPLPQTPTDVVTGLAVPWSVVFAGGSVLISERDSARVLEVTAAGAVRETAVIDGVASGGEGGLLGLAVAPAGDALYVYSTGADANRVQRYPLEGEAGAWALGSPTTVMDGLPRAGNHNGGRIAFGPDGTLYITTGDAGDPATAQDPDSLAGKILRVTPEGDIPADNPFAGSPVYSLGHRNVQGMAWAEDGRLFASEFGQNAFDELNIIEPGGNYGWPEFEGAGGAAAGFVDPVQQWPTDAASPSGIAVVGDTIYIANLRGRVLRAVPVDDPSTATEHLAGEYGRLRAVAAAPDGALWIVTNNTDGRGDPAPGDDRIVAIDPAVVAP